jgi:Flp pilus assembly protein TadD
MANFSTQKGIASRLLGTGVIFCVISACAAGAGATKPPEDPAKLRAEALRKLSATEIIQAADLAARRGEFDRAAGLYNQAIEVEPSADLWFRVGWIYSQLGKKQPAAQAFAMTIKYDPKHAQAHEELGMLYLDSKQRENGAVHLKEAVAIDPSRWRSHNALGVLADASEDYATAIQHYEAALATNPDSAMLLNNLGYSHYLAGDLDQAEQFYGQAVALEPGHRAALANMGLLHARRGDYERAVEVVGSVMDKAKTHNDVAYIALQNGDLDVAEALLAEAIRLSPSYYETAQQNLKRVRRAQAAAADRSETQSPDTGTRVGAQSATWQDPAGKAGAVAAR